MQVRLLGPIDVVVDGVARPVSGIRRKALLAVIALHRGDIVSTERLVELVWGGAGTPIVANTIQTHMSQLRRLLGDRTAIEARPPGYRLNVGVDGTDVEVVEGIIRHGVRLPDPVERAGQMRTALASACMDTLHKSISFATRIRAGRIRKAASRPLHVSSDVAFASVE